MMEINEEKQLTPVQMNDELFDLESLITEGTNALIPLKFIYPGTTKPVGVFIRPVTTQEFSNAMNKTGGLILNVVASALYDRQQQPISLDIVCKLPAGVTLELYKKIAEISGIPTDENDDVTQEMFEKLMGF